MPELCSGEAVDERAYTIYGTYRGEEKKVDGATGLQELEYLLTEYRMAYGPDYTWRVQEGAEDDNGC